MIFSGVQLAFLHTAIRVEHDPNSKETLKEKARYFPMEKQLDALMIEKKIRGCLNEEKKVFEESDIEFSTTEKAILLEVLKRPWQIGDLNKVEELRKLLA